MKFKKQFILSFIILLFILIFSCIFVVNQTERAILLRLGKVTDGDLKPGLHFKLPFIHSVKIFDGRLLTLDSLSSRFLTLEKKALMVSAYAKWKIKDAEKYYQSTSGNIRIANDRLLRRLEAFLRDQIGKRALHEAVAGERDKLMQEVTLSLNNAVKNELGIEVVDVRVKALDLPEEVNLSVYSRMSTEREREASEHRAKGKEVAEGIKANADRQYRVLLANAYKQAEQIRGEGDAKASEVYAQAYAKDIEFYQFYQSLNNYKESFKTKQDLILLNNESEFLHFFNKSSK